MEYFSPQDQEAIRNTKIRMLIYLSRADDRHHPMEDRMIREVGNMMGFSDTEIETIRHEPSQEPLEIPKREEDRLRIFYHLLFLMRIDSEVSPTEMEVCRQLGFQLNLNPFLTDELIRLMAEYAHEKLPADAMLNLVRKYQN